MTDKQTNEAPKNQELVEVPLQISYEQSVQMVRNPMLMPGQIMKRLVYQAKQFYDSGLLPESIRTPQAAMVIMMKGIELGFSPMEAFSHIHVIKGKPSLSAEGMKNLVYRNCPKARIEIIEQTDETCVLEGEKPHHKPFRMSFTIEDAKRAELLNKAGDMWRKYPKAMLFSRALSALCRAYFSEFLCGVSYTSEELGATVDENGDPVNVTPERGIPKPPQVTPKRSEPIDAEMIETQEAQALPPEPGSFAAFDASLEVNVPVPEPLMAPLGDLPTDTKVPPVALQEEPHAVSATDVQIEQTLSPDTEDTKRLASIEEKSLMWTAVKELFDGNEIKAKATILSITGKTSSKEWTLGDQRRVLGYVLEQTTEKLDKVSSK